MTKRIPDYGDWASLNGRAGAGALLAPLAGVGSDWFADLLAIQPLTTKTGNAGDNTLTSGSGSDSLSGLGGNDTLIGGGGQDTLNGGTGLDSMTGGAGNDRYYVGDAGDEVVELAGEGSDTVYYSGQIGVYVLADNIENLVGQGAWGNYLVGNNLANTITGTNAGDVIVGAGGNDTLKGLGGDDDYILDRAGDVIAEAANGGTDEVWFDFRTYTLPGNVEWAYARNDLGATVTGNGLSNYIDTGIGNDSVNGAAGDDFIFCGTGNDTMTGAAGADWFEFAGPFEPGTTDTVTDFNTAADTIYLNGFDFGLAAGDLSSTAFKVIGGAGAGSVDSTDRILYDQSTGKLYFDPDGNGAAARAQFVVLTGKPVLAFDDFAVY